MRLFRYILHPRILVPSEEEGSHGLTWTARWSCCGVSGVYLVTQPTGLVLREFYPDDHLVFTITQPCLNGNLIC